MSDFYVGQRAGRVDEDCVRAAESGCTETILALQEDSKRRLHGPHQLRHLLPDGDGGVGLLRACVTGFRSTEQFEGDGCSVPMNLLDPVRHVWVKRAPMALVGRIEPVVIDCKTAVAARITESEETRADKTLLRGIAVNAEVIPGTVEVDLVWLDTDTGVLGEKFWSHRSAIRSRSSGSTENSDTGISLAWRTSLSTFATCSRTSP